MEDKVSREACEYQSLVEDQRTKTRSRTLSDYDSLVFGHVYDSEMADSGAIDGFVENYYGNGIKGFKDLIDRIYWLKGDKVVWTEMGGGGAVVMRQLTSLPGMREKLMTFNVDLFDFEDMKMEKQALAEIARKTPRALQLENKPKLIRENMERVKLPMKADVITSVASIFYSDNPLAAVCNWYNQLVDKGILIVAAEEKWTNWIESEGSVSQFLKELGEAGVSLATNGKHLVNNDKYGHFNLMMIERTPGTELTLQSKVDRCETNLIKRKEVYYRKSDSMVKVEEVI